MPTQKIATAIVQYVITTRDDQGEPINEQVSQPIRLFRVVHPDIWAHGDKQAFPPPPADAA